jgi:hypothetical protein
MCTNPSLKLKGISTLMIKGAKELELIKKNYSQFEHIWLKNVFDPKNYGF